jgi:hypothetical protein
LLGNENKSNTQKKTTTDLNVMKWGPSVNLHDTSFAVQASAEAVRAAKHCTDTITALARANSLVNVVTTAIMTQKLVEEVHAI